MDEKQKLQKVLDQIIEELKAEQLKEPVYNYDPNDRDFRDILQDAIDIVSSHMNDL